MWITIHKFSTLEMCQEDHFHYAKISDVCMHVNVCKSSMVCVKKNEEQWFQKELWQSETDSIVKFSLIDANIHININLSILFSSL